MLKYPNVDRLFRNYTAVHHYPLVTAADLGTSNISCESRYDYAAGKVITTYKYQYAKYTPKDSADEEVQNHSS